jgi:hormone-sensitive lipase
VSQSVKSCEGYLRPLAKELDVPLVSINYSHAPEAPFPRAFDECTYVYAWILKNLEQLGSTGERIVLLGDSAGGNLVVAVALKARKLGLRVPDAVVPIYPALLCKTVISPSRSLSIMDPLLPVGILLSCLQAYTGSTPGKATYMKRMELRAMIQKYKGKEPSCDENGKEFKKDDSSLKRTESVSSRISLRKAMKTRSSVNKSCPKDGSSQPKELPSRPPPPSASPTLTRTQSLSSKPSLPSRPPPPRANTIQSLPIALIPEKPVDSSPSTPGLLEADELVEIEEESSVVEEEEELEPVSFVEDSCDTSKKPAAPVLMTTDPKDGVLKPAMYPPKIEALAADVLQSYRDSPTCSDPFVSPYMAPPEMWKGLPPIHLVACELDPLLDDSVAMARKLQSYGHPVSLDIMPGLCHGFLSFAGHPNVSKAIEIVTAIMKKELNIPVKKQY